MIKKNSEKEGELILNIFNRYRIKKLISESQDLITKYDNNFKLPKLILRYDDRFDVGAAIKPNDNKWFLKINKKDIPNENLMKYRILHECIHYWIGNDFKSGYTFCPDSCPYSSNVNCFQVNKNCSSRLRLYCLLFQKTKLEPNIKLTRVGTHINKYISFEEVIVDFAVMSILPQDIAQTFSINYELNLFEKEILGLLRPHMPNLPFALENMFKNFKL